MRSDKIWHTEALPKIAINKHEKHGSHFLLLPVTTPIYSLQFRVNCAPIYGNTGKKTDAKWKTCKLAK